MSDLGSKYTDKQIAEIEKRIKKIYAEAQRDIDAKLKDFIKRYKEKEKIHLQELKDGKITQADFDSWKRGQVFQGRQWVAKRNQISETLYNANKAAVQIVNGKMTNVFSYNANFMNYTLEHGEGVNFGFGLYDNATVANLVKNDPNLLPTRKVNKRKDEAWNRKNVTSQVTQGIIQGESLDQIADRIATKTASTNHSSMLTAARTAMTGAQNAGRQISLSHAKDLSINVQKQWMCTLDGRTRDTHRELDGQSVLIEEPFKVENLTIMYPGDPEAHPSMIYNCRCTMVGDLVDYPSEYKRYDNIDGVPIKNMTYKQWYNAKYGVAQVQSFQSALGGAKTVEEVAKLMNSQGWFRRFSANVSSEANLIGCDLDSAKAIAASYEQVFEKYPQLKGKFDAPNAHPQGMKKNTYAWCHMRNGRVEVNPSQYGDWSKLVDLYEHDVSTKWHPYGTTAESIIVHELGHAIDALLARKGIKGGVTSSGQYRYASSTLRNMIMSRAAKKDTEIAKYWDAKDWSGKPDKFWQSHAVEESVSRYATKDNKEWFAECFAEYITSANPRIVAREFGKELERLLSLL